MSDYKLSDFNEAGIDQFVRDLSSPPQDRWDEKSNKNNVCWFTPVEYLSPSHSLPFPFDDKLTGERLDFPSKKEWQECPIEKKTELLHKSIDDFESYRADYNKRVDEYYKKEGLNDLVKQMESGIRKYEKGYSHYEFMTINQKFHYAKVADKIPKKYRDDYAIHWRHVDNERVYNAIIDMSDEDAIKMINSTVYDFILCVTKNRELKEGDLYYNPMRELRLYAETESIDLDAEPNLFDIERQEIEMPKEGIKIPSVDFTKEKYISWKDWTIRHHMGKQSLEFIYKKGGKKQSSGLLTYEECGFNYHKTGVMPRKIELLERYAIFFPMRMVSRQISVSQLWEDTIIIKSRRYTVKHQRELQDHLRAFLHIDIEDEENLFVKEDDEVGKNKFTYYRTNLLIMSDIEMKESHKRLNKTSQKELKSNIENYKRDKATGEIDIEGGVFHYGLDDSDLQE